jgi:putative N-acetylmannosamine-6-phosphate epimerase
MEIKRGIIVSIQGYSRETTRELSIQAISAGAVAIRTDKPVKISMEQAVPIIGLHKENGLNRANQAYITQNIREVQRVMDWSDYVAVDCRQCNQDIADVVEFCRANKVRLVADVGCWEDYAALKAAGVDFAYVTSALSVYRKRFYPDKRLAERLAKVEPKKVIAEGNFRAREDVAEMWRAGVQAVCIGGAITDVYKLTRKYTTIEIR